MDAAMKVFDEMPKRDLVAWNALISCYSKAGMGERSIRLFQQLGKEGIQVDEYTYAIVLNELVSCLLVFEAMQLHSDVIRRGLGSDHFINNALLELYSKCGFVASFVGIVQGDTLPRCRCLDNNYYNLQAFQEVETWSVQDGCFTKCGWNLYSRILSLLLVCLALVRTLMHFRVVNSFMVLF